MSTFLLVNNLHFTVELIGALVFFMMAWLSADANVIGRQAQPWLRTIGFLFIGIWQTIFALSLSNDLLAIVGSFLYLAGIVLIIVSFLSEPLLKPPSVAAVLLIPAFANISPYIDLLSAIGLGVIAVLAFRQFKLAFTRSLKFFWMGFLMFASASLASFFFGKTSAGIFFMHFFHLAGSAMLVVWVWQYLKLRLRESVVLIFISLTFFIATIVTLAFSTILMGKVEAETRASLAIDTRVTDLAIRGLLEEARAKSELLALDVDIVNAIEEKNSKKLEGLLSGALEKEKLGFLLVTDKQGTVLLRAHALSRHGDSLGNERAIEEALTGSNFVTIESSPGEKFSIRAAAPLYQKGTLLGALVAGFPLDNVFADRMKKITGLEMSIYEGASVIATTALDSDGRTRLSGIAIDEEEVKEAVLEKGEAFTARIELRGEQFLASYLPISNGDGKIIGMLSSSKPQQEILDLANASNRLTLVTVMLLLLILALPLYFLTRQVLGDARV